MPKIIYDTQWFIKKARKVHGNKYDYSKVDYKNNYTKITIICSEHGKFQQTPSNHLAKHGCPRCCGNVQLTTKEFTKLARKSHGNKYDYSKVVYKNNKTKIIIICPEHGAFDQDPVNHLKGHGCPVCSNNKKLTTSKFIEKAQKIHGSRYDYSKVDYKNNHTKITIVCKEHGDFKQKPSNHLMGKGCIKCRRANQTGPGFDRSNDPNPGFLYFLTCKLGNDYFCKIGTAYNLRNRFRLFPFEIIDSLIIPGTIGPLSIIEEKIKKDFEEYRYVPKVKFGGGATECFQISTFRQIAKMLG